MKEIIKDFILNSIAAGVLCHRRLRMKIYRLYGAEIPADWPILSARQVCIIQSL